MAALNASHTLTVLRGVCDSEERERLLLRHALKKMIYCFSKIIAHTMLPGQTRGGRKWTHARQRIKHINRTCTEVVSELKVSMHRGGHAHNIAAANGFESSIYLF